MRSTPRRRTTATGALIVAAAIIGVGFQTGTAPAAQDGAAAVPAPAPGGRRPRRPGQADSPPPSAPS